MGKFKIGHLSL